MTGESSFRRLSDYYSSMLLHSTALFYAERLYYENRTEENLHILAQCFYRMNKTKQVYLILQESTWPANRYLLATCCIELGLYQEAELALLPERNNYTPPEKLSLDDCYKIPGGASGLYLLGMSCKSQHRRDAAIEYFKKSLEVEPTLWGSIKELSEMGEELEVSKLFNIDVPTSLNVLNDTHDNLPGYNQCVNHNNVDHNTYPDTGDARVRSALKKENINPSRTLNNTNSSHTSSSNLNNKSLVLTNIKNRRLAESLKSGGAMSASPHTAMSIGMSCLSLRIPFASPGSAKPPIPLHNRTDIVNVMAKSTSALDLSAGVSVSGSNSNHNSTNMSNIDSTQRINDKRRQLPFDTPGLTPIGGGNDIRGSETIRGGALDVFAVTTELSSSVVTSGGNKDDDLPLGSRSNSYPSNHSNQPSTEFSTSISSTPRLPLKETDLTKDHRNAANNDNDNDNDVESEAVNSPEGILRYAVGGNGINGDEADVDAEDLLPMKIPRVSPGSKQLNEMLQNAGTTTAPNEREDTEVRNNYDHGGSRNNNKNVVDSTERITKLSSIPHPTYSDVQYMAAMVTVFARSYQLLYQYDCSSCVSLLHQLPRHHFACGFVQQLMGKAYFEAADYKPALLALKEMLSLEPYRIKGVDILSTTLWHLKRDKELCALAQRVVEVDKMAPEVWCVVGNSFSLQREPETSIKFFERALDINPSFAYAHTLCGHEYVSNEDLERAITSYRKAIKCDDRHYNAWWGLGAVFTRQERYDMAEYHFRRALQINPSSSVLRCYLGMTLHYQGVANPTKAVESIQVLSDASRADTKNAQLRFQLAHALVAAGNLEEARRELKLLIELVPREPAIFSMLGQVCQQLDYSHEAFLYYNTAIDLDPREAGSLKSAMASLGSGSATVDEGEHHERASQATEEQGGDEDELVEEMDTASASGSNDGSNHTESSFEIDMSTFPISRQDNRHNATFLSSMNMTDADADAHVHSHFDPDADDSSPHAAIERRLRYSHSTSHSHSRSFSRRTSASGDVDAESHSESEEVEDDEDDDDDNDDNDGASGAEL